MLTYRILLEIGLLLLLLLLLVEDKEEEEGNRCAVQQVRLIKDRDRNIITSEKSVLRR